MNVRERDRCREELQLMVYRMLGDLGAKLRSVDRDHINVGVLSYAINLDHTVPKSAII